MIDLSNIPTTAQPDTVPALRTHDDDLLDRKDWEGLGRISVPSDIKDLLDDWQSLRRTVLKKGKPNRSEATTYFLRKLVPTIEAEVAKLKEHLDQDTDED